MDAMFSTAAIACAETIINAALDYDPATRIALGALAPQVLAINISSPDICIFVAPTSEGIRLLGQYEGDVTTQIQGTVPALMSLLRSERVNLKDTGVTILGSTTFLAELQHIMKNVDLDWEEMLSQITGDLVGHQAAEIIRSKMQWGKDRASNLQRLTSEFLTEELSALPSKAEIDFFNHDVDDLRFAVERIEARLAQMAQAINSPKNHS